MNKRTILISRSEGRLIPWPNGLGTSREILLEERASPQGEPTFLWRLATTRIENDCPFSDLPGEDRTIVLLRGNGFELTHDSRETQTARAPFTALAFAGNWRTRCRLLDGPVDVLNLLSSRAHARCSLSPMRLLSNTHVQQIPEGATAVYVLAGRLSADTAGGVRMTVEEGDTLQFEGGASACLKLCSGPAPAHLLILEARVVQSPLP